nr:uncharacterized protein LOC127328915 [Lolium perenne]
MQHRCGADPIHLLNRYTCQALHNGCIPASGDVNEKQMTSGKATSMWSSRRHPAMSVWSSQRSVTSVWSSQRSVTSVWSNRRVATSVSSSLEGKPTSNASMRSERTSGDVHE